jgi:hypothetical protein
LWFPFPAAVELVYSGLDGRVLSLEIGLAAFEVRQALFVFVCYVVEVFD